MMTSKFSQQPNHHGVGGEDNYTNENRFDTEANVTQNYNDQSIVNFEQTMKSNLNYHRPSNGYNQQPLSNISELMQTGKTIVNNNAEFHGDSFANV